MCKLKNALFLYLSFRCVQTLTHLLTYVRSWALPEKLPIVQPFRKFPAILRNPKIHHRVHESPPLVPILSQFDPAHTIPTYINIKTFFFLFFIIWFVRLLALRPLLAYCASLGWQWRWLWRSIWNVDWQGNRSSRRKPAPAPLLSTTKSHMTRPGFEPEPPRWEDRD
jgi:hypothetical protein